MASPQIKINLTATFKDESQREFETTKFDVFPVQDKSGTLYVKLEDGYTFICSNIRVEQVIVTQN